MDLQNKSECVSFSLIENEGPATEIVKFLENFAGYNLQLLNRRMYHVVIPKIMYTVYLYRTKIEIVLQNATGSKLYYYTIDKNT